MVFTELERLGFVGDDVIEIYHNETCQYNGAASLQEKAQQFCPMSE